MLLKSAAMEWKREMAGPEPILCSLGISSSAEDVGVAFGVFEDVRAAAAFRKHGVPRDVVSALRDQWRRILLGGWERIWRARHPHAHAHAHAHASQAAATARRDDLGDETNEDSVGDEKEEVEEDEEAVEAELDEERRVRTSDGLSSGGSGDGGDSAGRSRSSSGGGGGGGDGIGLRPDDGDEKRTSIRYHVARHPSRGMRSSGGR